MATIGSGSPLLYVESSAAQTGGSGNTRTIKVTAKFKVNGGADSWYGYKCSWRPSIIVGSTYTYGSWKAIKGTENWNGSNSLRVFEQTLTVDVGTTAAKAVTVKIETDSEVSVGWDGSYSYSYTTGTTNTPPKFPDGAYARLREWNSTGTVINDTGTGTENATKIWESISSIFVYWPAASDAGDTVTYEIWNQQNESSWSKIGESTSKTTISGVEYYYYTHSIGTGNGGRSYDYYIKARDSKGAKSGNIDAVQFQKNDLTPHSITSSPSISATTTSISFSFSGASNTNGNTAFSQTISCDGLTVYNGSVASSPATVTVWDGSGSAPSGCYIKKADLRSKFGGSNYTGTLSFKLNTKNYAGTVKSTSKSVYVNITAAPVCSSAYVSTESSCYKQVKTGASNTINHYYIPNPNDSVKVQWAAATSSNGGTVVYDLFYRLGASTSWTKLVSDTSSTTYYHRLGSVSSAQSLQYLIRSKLKSNPSSYSDKLTSSYTMHSYSYPTASAGSVARASTSVSVPVTLTSVSSIPSIVVSGTATLYSGSTVVGSAVSLGAGSKTVTISGLTENGTYTLKIVYLDKTGLSASTTLSIPVGALTPAVTINKYGLGVGGKYAGTTYCGDLLGAVRVGRPANGATQLMFNTERPWYFTQLGTGAETSLGLVSATSGKCFHISNSDFTHKVSILVGDTSVPVIYVDNYKVYHSGNKPSATDIGAISAIMSTTGHWEMRGPGGAGGWLRTPAPGILPYANGTGALGTSSWRFSNIWGNALNGYSIGGWNNGYTNSVPVLSADGVMDVGRMVSFHPKGSSSGGTNISLNGDTLEFDHIIVSNHLFKGWALTSSGTYFAGISGGDDFFRTYDAAGAYVNNVMSLGSTSYRWKRLYSVEAASVSSDRRHKENIKMIDSKVEVMYSLLKPCSWTRKDGDTGRRHYGFIAQEVEEAMKASDISYKEFAFLQKGPLDETGDEIRPCTIEDYDTDERIKDYEYSLAYDELIAVNTHMIQKLQKENQELRKELDEIKTMLKMEVSNES